MVMEQKVHPPAQPRCAVMLNWIMSAAGMRSLCSGWGRRDQAQPGVIDGTGRLNGRDAGLIGAGLGAKATRAEQPTAVRVLLGQRGKLMWSEPLVLLA